MDWDREEKKSLQTPFDSEKTIPLLQVKLSTSDNLFPKLNPEEFRICMQKFTTCFINLVYKNHFALYFFFFLDSGS